ncbi:hypothetical protein Syun_002027 [Stephania yunnanensis]|uniref:Uncharacterized protein n=1 Tax=Stephania yunnanensis TaxID=152371 RepID=A0AAP0LEQ0_9MAGN
MDRILPFERMDSVGSAARWRDSHHGSREFARWGSEDLRRPSGHGKQGGTPVISRRSPSGFAPSRACGKRSAKRESGFRPSALWEATGSIMPVAACNQSGLSPRETGEEGTATPRKRLVKKSGDRARTPDFGIEDEEPAFMRDEFVSEPPSSQKRKWSKEDGFRKKEKKLKGDKEFDKGGSLSAIYPWPRSRDEGARDTAAGGFSRMTKKVEVLWSRGAKEKWLAVRLTRCRAILKQAYVAITNSEEILLAVIQTESRHGNKKESDILMARQKTLFAGRADMGGTNGVRDGGRSNGGGVYCWRGERRRQVAVIGGGGSWG